MARIVRIGTGSALVIAGTAMLVLPGPGVLTILGGLALLARDLEWANRLDTRVKDKWARLVSRPSESNQGDSAPVEHQAGG